MADTKEVHDGTIANSETTSHGSTKDLSSVESNSDESSHRGDVFDTAGLEDLYKPIATYEGIHRYDPKFQWHDAEEKKVVRKVC